MPSKKRQLNMRPDDATWAAIDRVKPMAEASVGLELSYADLLRLAVAALEEKCRAAEAKKKGKANP